MKSIINLIILNTMFLLTPLFGVDNMSQAVEAWSLRGDGFQNGVVDPTQVQLSIDALERELAENPANLEACSMLMEALYFKGDYVAKEQDQKKKIYDRGLEISVLAFKTLAPGKDAGDLKPEKLVGIIKSDPHAIPVCFWTSVMWGLWGDNYGSFQAARKGVAGKIRSFAEAVILMDPQAFDGGGYRMLGRLHTLAPKVPFFTGWINREKAVSYLEQAIAASKKEPLNQFYLAEALIKFNEDRRAEAVSILDGLAKWEVDPTNLVEQSITIKKAATLQGTLN